MFKSLLLTTFLLGTIGSCIADSPVECDVCKTTFGVIQSYMNTNATEVWQSNNYSQQFLSKKSS